MHDFITYFITWTTYGTWLPGDDRGWRKPNHGNQKPQPLLADWCRRRLKGTPIILNPMQRQKVERVCREHATIRKWALHAISARSNHVQLLVTADEAPELVRDQFKANATRVLRQGPGAIAADRIWTRGGDCEIIDDEDALERVRDYIVDAQDRMDRGK